MTTSFFLANGNNYWFHVSWLSILNILHFFCLDDYILLSVNEGGGGVLNFCHTSKEIQESGLQGFKRKRIKLPGQKFYRWHRICLRTDKITRIYKPIYFIATAYFFDIKIRFLVFVLHLKKSTYMDYRKMRGIKNIKYCLVQFPHDVCMIISEMTLQIFCEKILINLSYLIYI